MSIPKKVTFKRIGIINTVEHQCASLVLVMDEEGKDITSQFTYEVNDEFIKQLSKLPPSVTDSKDYLYCTIQYAGKEVLIVDGSSGVSYDLMEHTADLAEGLGIEIQCMDEEGSIIEPY